MEYKNVVLLLDEENKTSTLFLVGNDDKLEEAKDKLIALEDLGQRVVYVDLRNPAFNLADEERKLACNFIIEYPLNSFVYQLAFGAAYNDEAASILAIKKMLEY